MSWLTNFIRPRIRSLVQPREVPDNLWQKCPGCEGMLFHRDLEKNLNVCYHCGHHLRIGVLQRLSFTFDDGAYETIDLPNVAADPLKFRDKKKYSDRLKDTRAKTGLKDAMTIARGTIGGQNAVIAAFNFDFMGGSMGAGVGEAIVKAAEEAVRTRSALIIIPSSGGARMQEGMLSLVQMPRTIIAVDMVKEERLPYIVLLTDPTTGGVSASFAMVGDIHLAEPGSTIGFAGRRVIEETVRETLPADFQTAEYLQAHGMVDMVVSRAEIHDVLGRILRLLMHKTTEGGFGSAPDYKKAGSAGASGRKMVGPANTRSSFRAVKHDSPVSKTALKQVRTAQKAVDAYKSKDTPKPVKKRSKAS